MRQELVVKSRIMFNDSKFQGWFQLDLILSYLVVSSRL